MTANELRIGNWVEWEGNPYRVEQIHFDLEMYCFWLGDDEAKIEWVKPIPLTSEILEKAGFDYDTVRYYRNGVSIGDFKSGLHLATSPISKDSIEIEYLHQLQNLYFALTGKELEINL